ncbi:mannonate dehydratase [Pontibacter sp. HSC-14F20]|uniref:mannonate dehydratase n=1 Tax=Pontibacter sp. HSC-14F20 TaxID=2864136 RepID=UPI001C72AA67|nr:mannonate dehydratase [Pontibacter sp. HSC-14F20]MBX0335127.1 mannonate dehydratase [Pontibacter sp. HSC-14F20]
MSLLQSWRWYGPNDPVALQDVRQAGATGIVSALHHIPHGEVWPLEEIQQRKSIIEAASLEWVVVESVPVHESIKTRRADCDLYLENYRQTLRNLAACGIKTVCYNFMPVLDWTRTNLAYELKNGAKALYFDWVELAIFDMFILQREGAKHDYAEAIVQQAVDRYKTYSEDNLRQLSDTILMGVPTEGSVTIPELLQSIEIYKNIGYDGLRENLAYFLESVIGVCEETGINMTIHPDDPPFAILGLPRIATSKEDLLHIITRVDHPANGICFCTGSLGAGSHNNPVDTLKAVGHRVYFAHLRNVLKDETGNFYESDHLAGDVDMFGVMQELVRINEKREQPIPFRPDHGHQMLDDLHKVTNPGYSAIGRLRGLAELRGLEMGIARSMKQTDVHEQTYDTANRH